MSVKIIDTDKGWKRISKELKSAKKSYVNIGILSDAPAYATDEGPVNLADIATFNEFGTSRIPERPFMRQAFDANLEGIMAFRAGLLNQVYDGRITTEMGLRKLGVFFKGKVQETIAKGEFAPNAPATLKAKAPKTKPLINTGHLRQSIDFEVISK